VELVLSEVLRDLRKAEKCYIKYELKQGCFHITTRGKGYYQLFSDAYKRIRIAYIEAARKRPEEFEKRLNNFISNTN